MATGTGISAGNRALKGRAGRKLPAVEVPRSSEPSVQRAIENIAEHLRAYEGEGNAPKERFVTMRELEEAGLVTLGTKNGYTFISQILKKDVAQKSGSTANPTLKGTVKKDTALGPRTPGGGGGGWSNPIEAGKRSRVNKLSDIENVKVASPAQADFLYYDGGKWKNFSLFKRENKWLKKQNFEAGIRIAGTDLDLSGYLTAALLESGSYTPTGTWDYSGATLTIPESSVTAHEAALSITESQISDFGSYEPADADIAKVNEDETISGSWTITGLVDLRSTMSTRWGINGDYSTVGGGSNYGATIWSLDTPYDGGEAGTDSVNTSVYGIRWLRSAHANADGAVGEGLYGFINGVQYFGMGTVGGKFAGPVRIIEQGAADAAQAGYGQLWVKSDTPNNLYFTDDAGNDVQITNNGALAGGQTFEAKVKTADQTYSSQTTFQSDTHLTGFALTAGVWYELSGSLEVVSNSAADIKLLLSFSNAPNVSAHAIAVGAGTGAQFTGDSSSAAASTLQPAIITTDTVLLFRAVFQANAVTGGTVELQHAQNTSTAVTSGLRAGSTLTLRALT